MIVFNDCLVSKSLQSYGTPSAGLVKPLNVSEPAEMTRLRESGPLSFGEIQVSYKKAIHSGCELPYN